ncbi:MAG: glycosyltransferase [Opitutaceae bacterium]|nr:glycosyltransferase [Opitutaceae bacterium]
MRILVSKPDSLGDQLIIAPLLQAVAAANPDSLVVWHVREGMEKVAPLFPGVASFKPDLSSTPEAEAVRFANLYRSGLIIVPFPLFPFADWAPETERRLEWWRTFLQSQHWDAAVAAVGNRTWVAEATIAASRAPLRIGAIATQARQIPVNTAGDLIAGCTPLFTTEVSFDPELPETHLLRALFHALPLPAHPRWDAPAELTIGRHEPFATKRYVVLAPGVGGPIWRAWPSNRFMELEKRLRADGWTVTYAEGPGDAAYLSPMRAAPGRDIHTFVPDDLLKLADLFRLSSAVICNDSAYVHLAALLDVPAIGIFGGGQRQRFHPQSGRIKILQSLPECAGCQWHCIFESFPCISDIPVDAVWSAFECLMEKGDRKTQTFVPAWPEDRRGAALVARLQREILFLDADRFARLQIIQSLLNKQQGTSERETAQSLPPSDPPVLSIVVPMGRPESAGPTLDALVSQVDPGVAWEIVVAGAGDAVIPQQCKGVTLQRVVLPNRAPPSQTRNAGVTRARGRWLVFIDDDIQPAADFLSCAAALVNRIETDGSSIAVIGARLPGRRGGFWERVTDLSNFWSQQDMVARNCDWLYSAALIVRADVFRNAGGFDPQLAVGEDVDLCHRIAARGLTLRYEPSLVAYHDHQRNTPFRTWRYFWRNGEGARYFFRAIGGTCAFSLKTVWLKTWSDYRGNKEHQKRFGGRLGRHAPAVWLNYLIVETSLEWHWQKYLRQERRYADLPAHTRSDATAARALSAFDARRPVRGAWLSFLATLQDFSNPVRR